MEQECKEMDDPIVDHVIDLIMFNCWEWEWQYPSYVNKPLKLFNRPAIEINVFNPIFGRPKIYLDLNYFFYFKSIEILCNKRSILLKEINLITGGIFNLTRTEGERC